VCYEEEESKYIENIEQINHQITKKEDNLVELRRKHTEAQKFETKNEYGIMDSSELKVVLVEAQDIFENDNTRRPAFPVVQVTFQNQIVETKDVVEKTDSPSWNQEFIFKVRQPQGDMLVTVFNKKKDYQFIGQFSVSLEELKDQKLKEKWVQLLGKNEGEVKEGRLLIHMQWIHSKVLLLEELIRHLEEGLLNEKVLLNKFKKELEKLGNPFERGIVNYEKYEKKVEEFVQNQLGSYISNWERAQYLLCLIYTALSTVSCFSLPGFINLTLGVVGLLEDLQRFWTSKFYWIFIASLVGSFLFDAIWFYTSLTSQMHALLESKLFSAIYFISIAASVVKVLYTLVVFKNYRTKSKSMVGR